MTMQQINAFQEFAGFQDCIAPMEGPLGRIADLTLEQFASLFCWNPVSMADGYNRLLEIRRAGKRIYYPLWKADEAEKNIALKERYMVHFPVEKKAPFVIVIAGGGYMGCASMSEAYPMCNQLNKMGYHAFSLNYRCGENAIVPHPLEDMKAAVAYIFEHAEELGVDSKNYAVAGFSAGGHLASCFAAETIGWKQYDLPAPAVLFLAYPVITLGKYSHESTRRLFLGKENVENKKMIEKYSSDCQVTKSYPPTFMWQCSRDNEVPIENTEMMENALKANKIPYIYETFDDVEHGWGIGEGTLAEGWVQRAVKFWEDMEEKENERKN